MTDKQKPIKSYSAGGIVINPEGKVLLVEQKGGFISFPKGHIEEGETAQVASRREIIEETGIGDLRLIKKMGNYERPKVQFNGEDDPDETKHLDYFLFLSKQKSNTPLTPSKDEKRAFWLDEPAVAKALTHPRDIAFYLSVRHKLPSLE